MPRSRPCLMRSKRPFVGRPARSIVAMMTLLIVIAAIAPVRAADTALPSPATGAARLLARYRTAIAALPKPPNMVFTYTEMRSDPQRIVTSAHRVYRDQAGDQRNDTIEVNGTPVRPPLTQTYQRAAWPYHADIFAVPEADYNATFAGTATIAGRRAEVYTVRPKTNAPFSITELALDPASALPLRERFSVSTRDCDGRGTIDFAPSGSYWLPTSVSVECAASGSASGGFKHTIRFADYRFPAAIPHDVLRPNGTVSQ
jgi:hypothetical protein